MSHWSSRLPVCFQHEGPGGDLCEIGILLLALSRYISIVSLHWWPRRDWSLWPRLRRALSQSVTRPSCWQCEIPLDLTQLFCPGFMLTAGLPSGFTSDIVGCWAGALCGACNLTAFIPCLTGPVDYPFASRHEGPEFNLQGGAYVKPGFSC